MRLVYDIEDPRTRQKKAVIIRHVHADGPYSARSPFSSWPSHSRYATGTGHLTRDGKDIRLDWPEEIPGEIPRRLDDDTSATNVEVKTWEPTIFTAPVGYPAETVQLKDGQQIEGPEGRYTAGVPVPESEEYRYFGQRVGIHGFSDEIKLEARQSKIAAGIMAELHGSGRVLKQDQTTHLKKKIMEDARAIWWKERQLLSPAAEAAKKAAEAKKERRETQLPKPTENDTDLVVDSALLESLQAAALKNRYNKADHRLRKRLSTANAAKNASKPAQEYGQFGEAERSWSINGDIVSENDQGAELGSSQRTAL